LEWPGWRSDDWIGSKIANEFLRALRAFAVSRICFVPRPGGIACADRQFMRVFQLRWGIFEIDFWNAIFSA